MFHNIAHFVMLAIRNHENAPAPSSVTIKWQKNVENIGFYKWKLGIQNHKPIYNLL